MPRTHIVARGPAERRLAEQLRISDEELLQPPAAAAPAPVPQADAVARLSDATSRELARLGPELESLDATLSGALENAAKKIAYQFEQLAERARKAAERKGDVTTNRQKTPLSALCFHPWTRFPPSASTRRSRRCSLSERPTCSTRSGEWPEPEPPERRSWISVSPRRKSRGPGKEEAGKEEDAHAG